MRPWHLGNTTVRSPFRLRDALIALSHSSLLGNIKGKTQENAFARLLNDKSVVAISRLDRDVSDLGRKWRAALSQLGFIVPEVPLNAGLNQELLGSPFTLTGSGQRLINATNVPAMQECFLRSLAAYIIPSVLEGRYTFEAFSPLKHTLSVMLKLEEVAGTSHLNFFEMALVVQLTSSSDDLEEVVNRILTLRSNRESSDNKRRFDSSALDDASIAHGYAPQTFNDYADVNLRYLKATGLVRSKGRGLTLVPEKHVFIEQLARDTSIPDSGLTYLTTLCSGATMPTDNLVSAKVVLNDLLDQLSNRSIPFDIQGKELNQPSDIAIVRYEIEDLLFKQNEREYALRQADEWNEIVSYMELIITSSNRARTLSNGEEIKIPKYEAPAYFEWCLWRAFLAINSLTNQPYEARRFKIDQDFLPVGTAPGGGPDLIFEFEEFVVVVEVTLTGGSRQEAVEGEPVRRHVAKLVEEYSESSGKPVYGLFIANKIDSNTAETFRIGSWYTKDDRKMRLDIVPVTLALFKEFFVALFESNRIDVCLVRSLLDNCSDLRPHHEAPEWKCEIERSVRGIVASL